MRREESLFVLHCFEFCTQHKAQHNTCNHSSEGSWRTDGFALFSPSGCLAAESVYPFRWRDAATKGHRPLLGGAQEGCCVCADGSPCRYITHNCRVPTEPFERDLLPSWYSSVRCHCPVTQQTCYGPSAGTGWWNRDYLFCFLCVLTLTLTADIYPYRWDKCCRKI